MAALRVFVGLPRQLRVPVSGRRAVSVQWQIDMLLGFAVGEILESPDKDDYGSTH